MIDREHCLCIKTDRLYLSFTFAFVWDARRSPVFGSIWSPPRPWWAPSLLVFGKRRGRCCVSCMRRNGSRYTA